MATKVAPVRQQPVMATKVSPSRSTASDYQPSYMAAAIAATLVFALYLVTLAPSVAMWDTGEYMAAVKVLGIPHPPGNPFFVLLGHAFASLPIPVSYAARINSMAALASALSAGLWFLSTERSVARWIAEKWQRLVVAALAAVLHHRVVVHPRVDRGTGYTQSRPPDHPGLLSARTGLLAPPGRISSSSSCRTRAADDAVADDSPLETRTGRSWCAHSWPHAVYLRAGARGLLPADQ